MSKDYFTRAEFRTFAGDPGGATPTYSDASIDSAQAEVIEELEKWARSAWPNVTGANGDGTAATLRTATQTFDGAAESFVLDNAPAAAISSLEADGEAVDAADYYSYLDEGYITAGVALAALPRSVVIAYTYGFAATPWAIKRAAMQATKSRLDQKTGKGGRIPANTSQYTTERTTFVFDRDRDDALRPWPWDEDASQSVRSYWSSERTMNVGAF